ncbi:MAG: multidrug DMT transporter permease [Bacteroidaceae bacterium]|nr:multidrug DMT transporter permease [Bacteroidaceae bacterium]
MFIVKSYLLAVILCVVTMMCWGSWGNTQKLASKSWRYELFYWDYVIGILLFSLVVGFTFGSFGEEGRSFTTDLAQLSLPTFGWIILGGVIFNLANILLSASISQAGMTVAFPIGVGLALVLGVIHNYILQAKGNALLLFLGVALVVVAIIVNGIASGRIQKLRALGATNKQEKGSSSRKGIILAIVAGVLMSFFYSFVAKGMDLDNFENPAIGKATPYTAFFIFSVGVFLSNFLWGTIAMKRPVEGEPVSYADYFRGSGSLHFVGLLGGIIWGLGTVLSYIAAGKAGAAISYALGQGAPLIAALWGVCVWKEFKGADRKTNGYLAIMFIFFLAGLTLIVAAGK